MNAIKGSDEWVAFLLNNGADPNKKCYGKYTPIMMVSGKGADTAGLAQWDRLGNGDENNRPPHEKRG